MPIHAAPRGGTLTWALPGFVVAVVVGMLLVGETGRQLASLLSPYLALAAAVAGIVINRSRGIGWWLVAGMVVCWSATGTMTHLGVGSTDLVDALVWTGQALGGVVIALVFTRRADGEQPRWSGLPFDLAVMLLVFGLTALQVVGQQGRGTLQTAAGVDILVMAFLVRYVATRRQIPVAAWLLLCGAFLGLVFDAAGSLQGRRMAMPGDPLQTLYVSGVLLQGLATLHPSMRTVVGSNAVAPRRRSSGALLGLLPLVAVPTALWWTRTESTAAWLPGWLYPLVSSLVAALCLVRATVVLRSGEHLAEHDPLTDQLNQLGLAQRYRRLPQSSSSTLLLLDIDAFQQVNDTYGHAVGNELLRQVARRLRAGLHPADLLARLGGDEFAVLRVDAADHDDVTRLAEELLAVFTEPFDIIGSQLRVQTSIGMACAGPETEQHTALPFDDLFTQADIALYAAKGAGGQRAVHFETEQQAEITRRYLLQAEVRDLLLDPEARVGHLEVHYQPLVKLATGEAMGAEALVRWRHPGRGLLYPDAFLDVVSGLGLDAVLDAAVRDVVIADVAAWRARGLRSLTVSLNLTRQSLEDPHLACDLLAALADAGVPAHLLHVEITEHQELREDGPAAESLRELRRAGITVDLDDYGVGYSSLAYLRRFPVQVLKLDRSIVETTGQTDEVLVSAVLAMAGALELDVLAEGVETEEQRHRLVELGVMYGQGYLFSKPLPRDVYEQSVLGVGELVT